ncbi:hypothetical protein B0I37DRAFT_402400 [Chaetomium sp. MPI-CAGE-AT-0009]|nr:hypothetical protein B0I37DRAFT_402400 [Chaetomium sp. MPI-CAGE-AT-0009]
MFGPGLLAVLTVSASGALGQAEWQPNQINTRICQWEQLRATVLRDTVYLDGGNLWWQPGFADGSRGQPIDDTNPLGHIYMLNFSKPFDTNQNISAILDVLDTGGANRAPTYEDGALLGNDAEFCLYGGMMARPIAASEPPGNTVLCYEKYQYGPERTFTPGFVNKDLPENMTRYIAYGGAASAPSENLAWYFSGLRSASKGKIYKPGSSSNGSFDAVHVSDTLITLDMERQRFETFKNETLPPGIPGRANPELVWVPVGRRGILVALGGVVYPDFANANRTSTNETASISQSPGFISTIDIYDVASGQWHRQKTTGGPSEQLTRGCAVVARAQDGSSFNIYYYGGFDGLHSMEPFSDDVWVLSLPSFTWVKLASGGTDGRAGHKCVTPYPDQMLAIGGYHALSSSTLNCLDETIRVFNLSSGKWLSRYDPAVYAEYTVPGAVVDKIGGSGTGAATARAPSPSWDSAELAGIFEEEYPMSKITTYYPYASIAPVNNTNPDVPPPEEEDDGGGLPSYLPPVLGVVLGLVFLTMVAVLILLWRRRRLLRRNGTASEAGTEDTNGNRIASWLRGQPTEVKTPTITNSSEYLAVSSEDRASVSVSGAPPVSIAEMMDTGVPIAELPDTSPRAELHSAALSPTAAAAATASLNNNTSYSSTHQTDHASSPSPQSTPPPIPQDNESPIFYRPDSDALGRGPTTASATASPTGTSPVHGTGTGTGTTAGRTGSGRSNKVLSGISNLSERDRAHLRQISDTTVSSVTTAPGAGGAVAGGNGNGNGNGHVTNERERMLSGVSAFSSAGTSGIYGGGGGGDGGVGGAMVVESPAVVSPPTATAGPGEGADYLSARPLAGQGQQGPGSPLRRSVFSEDISGGRRAGRRRGGS